MTEKAFADESGGRWTAGSRGRRSALTALVLVLVGCSSGPATTAADAGPPPPTRDAAADADEPACQFQLGRGYVLSRVALQQPGQGRDFNGDGAPDNALGALSALFNAGLADSIARGDSILIIQILDWDHAPSLDDPDIGIVFHEARDVDQPPDSSNNLSGEARFNFLAADYDVACQPIGRFDEGRIQNGVGAVKTHLWRWVNPWGGTIELMNVQSGFTLSSDFSRMEDGQLTGIWTICGLAHMPFPGTTTGSVLDTLAAGFLVQPDVDVDGDGLETLQVADGHIVGCVDGDGTTIAGPDCVCDPRIADGYSMALEFEGVRAVLVGIVGGL